MQALNATGSMLNATVSYQLGDWNDSIDDYGNNNITFGDDVKEAYKGFLKFNFILEES